MPSEPFAILAYVFMLIPGTLFLFQSEKYRPRTKKSAFKETATIVIASAACHLFVLFVFLCLVGVLGWSLPALRDFTDQALTDPLSMFNDNPYAVTWLFILLLAVSSAVGLFLGLPRIWNWLISAGGKAKIERSETTWTQIFHAKKGHRVFVEIQMLSGDWIYGELASHDPDADDDDNRTLVLGGSIYVRPRDAKEMSHLETATKMIVSSKEIEYLSVTYALPGAQEIPAEKVSASSESE